jgi:predicted acylesterase/phospholipase RssA
MALLRPGAVFDIVRGTSIGAIDAAFVAMKAIELEPVRRLVAKWELIRPGRNLAPAGYQ